MTINRLTLFKIPREEDLPAMLEQYRILQRTAVKVRLYISFLKARLLCHVVLTVCLI